MSQEDTPAVEPEDTRPADVRMLEKAVSFMGDIESIASQRSRGVPLDQKTYIQPRYQRIVESISKYAVCMLLGSPAVEQAIKGYVTEQLEELFAKDAERIDAKMDEVIAAAKKQIDGVVAKSKKGK